MTNVDVEEYLKRNGWTQYCGPNSWLHNRIGNSYSDTLTTEEAYKCQYEWDKEYEYR